MYEVVEQNHLRHLFDSEARMAGKDWLYVVLLLGCFFLLLFFVCLFFNNIPCHSEIQNQQA